MATLKLRLGAMRLVWGIPVTAMLMAGSILVLIFVYIQNAISFPGYDELWLACLTFTGTALGGAIGVRIVQLSWRWVIVAALFAGAGLIVLTRFVPALASFSPWRMDALGIQTTGFILLFLAVIAAGTFLLPLFDQKVRKSGPAPSLWKVALVAGCLCLLMMWAVTLVYSMLVVIFFASLLSLGITVGLILSLVDKTRVGAWLGGVSILTPFLMMAITLLGFRF